MKRTILASLLSLLAVFLVNTIVFYIDGTYLGSWSIESVLAFSSVFALFTLIVMLLWGLPIHLLLQKKNKTHIFYYIVAGGIPGLIVVGVFKPFGQDALQHLVVQSLYLVAIGIVAAMVFWSIAVLASR